MILDELANHARKRVADAQRYKSLEDIRREALALPKKTHRFSKALSTPELSFICEVKKASPSKGLIDPVFDYLTIARDYEQAGAACISCLTEPKWFLGSDEIFRAIRKSVSIPMIRKDFTVDEYQLYEAAILGADAVLLIAALLDTETIRSYLDICDELGMDALVEAHNEVEITSAVQAGARLIGVNNRDLKDFTVDFENALRLRNLIPEDALYVAESGVKNAEDVERLATMGADAVLVGEALMRSEDKTKTLEEFRRAASSSNRPAVKFCGISHPDDIEFCNQIYPDYVGFVFYPSSKRAVNPQEAAQLRKSLDPSIATVGVFVDADPQDIITLYRQGIISIAQLHGKETAAYLQSLRQQAPDLVIWQAFKLDDEKAAAAANTSSADLVLLDNGQGTGKQFEWDLLTHITRPFALAGGLQPETLNEALNSLRELHVSPVLFDVSSGIEKKDVEQKNPGQKDTSSSSTTPQPQRARKDYSRMRLFVDILNENSQNEKVD